MDAEPRRSRPPDVVRPFARGASTCSGPQVFSADLSNRGIVAGSGAAVRRGYPHRSTPGPPIFRNFVPCTAKLETRFTLLEVLIVVVIMAVLAATIIPQFRDVHQRRSRKHTSVQPPVAPHATRAVQSAARRSYPTGANNLDQLTGATEDGLDGYREHQRHPFGPYVQGKLPAQPFSGLNTVKLDTGTAGTTPTATAAPAAAGSIVPRPAKSGSTIRTT